jgi:hypothetical protein
MLLGLGSRRRTRVVLDRRTNPWYSLLKFCLFILGVVVWLHFDTGPEPHVTCIWTTTGHQVCGELQP